jgi:hypothetical protein
MSLAYDTPSSAGWSGFHLVEVSSRYMRRSVPEVPNPHFCIDGALCAKRFTSYSNIAIARNREMWDRRLWRWAPHIVCRFVFHWRKLRKERRPVDIQVKRGLIRHAETRSIERKYGSLMGIPSHCTLVNNKTWEKFSQAQQYIIWYTYTIVIGC